MQHEIWNFAGQLYARIGSRSHKKQNGTNTQLTMWRTHCADCGKLFELTTPQIIPKYITRRCAKHAVVARKVKQHIHWGQRIPLEDLVGKQTTLQTKPIKRTAAMFLAEPATVLTTPIGE